MLIAAIRAALPHARGGGPSGSPGSDALARSSPRTWGWTAPARSSRTTYSLFPTHVGVDPISRLGRCRRRPLPHARGGGPNTRREPWKGSGSSPRTWGWTPSLMEIPTASALFPTHVGVDPSCAPLAPPGRSLPHARGGGPKSYLNSFINSNSSPRTWGWTLKESLLVCVIWLFPTHVGVDRLLRQDWGLLRSLPHARGGGPSSNSAAAASSTASNCSSPRTWGWTLGNATVAPVGVLFPTHVGVDRAGQRR